MCVCVCVCMRDVKEEHTLAHVLSAFLGAKDKFDTNESEVSFPSNRRYQCSRAGGGAGRPKAYCLLGLENTVLP